LFTGNQIIHKFYLPEDNCNAAGFFDIFTCCCFFSSLSVQGIILFSFGLKIEHLIYASESRKRGEVLLTDNKTGAPPGDEIVRVKLPQKRNREMFGCADLMMGANHIRVRGFDGVTRMGRIKGKIKKKVWIREGDILIIIPWNFQDEKCDIIYRYTGPQVEWLRRNNYL
jgi:translation initiation factor 1A